LTAATDDNTLRIRTSQNALELYQNRLKGNEVKSTSLNRLNQRVQVVLKNVFKGEKEKH